MAKRLESLLYVFLYLVIFVFSQLASIVMIPLCNTILKLINGYTNPDSLIAFFLASVDRVDKGSVVVLVSSMVLSVLIFMYVMKIRNRSWKKAILKKTLGAREIIASFFLAYGLNILAIEITAQPFFERFVVDYDTTITSIVTGDVYVIFLIVGILAPIFEELMYRGVVLNELSSARPFLLANLLQAAVFGIMHMNVIQGTYAFVIGFILGYAYKITKSIYMTMLTHFLFNASNLLVADYISLLFNRQFFLSSGFAAILISFLLMSRFLRHKHIRAGV